MTDHVPSSTEITETLHDNWVWFLILGIVLIIVGVFAVAAPLASSIAVTLVLAIALIVGGAAQAIQAFRVQSSSAFIWHLLVAIAAILGGIAIYIHPLIGTLALTLVVAAVFLMQGIFQLLLGLNLRRNKGWLWIVGAGAVSILVALMIFTGFPASAVYVLGILAGVAIAFNGWSYVAIALAAKNVEPAI
ncbi:HdeD family acid-resistance protein [Rhodobium gokarnense]|uniref:Uncharacterized membrane protein HdeD (DUF308 family) n=1 Tax=Rhodobium gokarnense TaxID=364296 RepID=A0ABT3HD99_9HYPH|nr:HdeD family acid-resistance protein [Rhodobium gokarnense]MCW2308353.1 uncharacterized membrane protein HdeD (DUF308 family) [Rhodobium gokarnense]